MQHIFVNTLYYRSVFLSFLIIALLQPFCLTFLPFSSISGIKKSVLSTNIN